MAEWCAKVLGLPGMLAADRVQKALDTIERLNMSSTSYGLVNGMTPAGERVRTRDHPNDHAPHIFVGENLCAAMTFMYHRRVEAGLEIARRLYEAMALKSFTPWSLLHK
jgi:uncharacterized protein (DUF608 family)